MKKNLLFLLIPILILQACTQVVEKKELTQKNDIVYQNEKKTPYSGKVYEDFSNGDRKMEGYYLNGKMNGAFIEWHENGEKKSEIYYANGKKDGNYTLWYENGKISETGNYSLDKLEGEHTKWYENGEKKSSENYSNNILNGNATYWYADGKKHKILNYLNGKKDGSFTEWYENGEKKAEITYSNGKITDAPKEWNITGEPKLGKIKAKQIIAELDTLIIDAEISIMLKGDKFLHKIDKAQEQLDKQKEIEKAGLISHKIYESVVDYYGKETEKFVYTAELTEKAKKLIIETINKGDISTYKVNCGSLKFKEITAIVQNDDDKYAQIEYTVIFIPTAFGTVLEDKIKFAKDKEYNKSITVYKFEDDWKIKDKE